MTKQTLAELAEQLEDQTRALGAFSRLCAGCHPQPVYLPDFAYLLDPIIARQHQIIDALHELAHKPAEKQDRPEVIQLRSLKGENQQVTIPPGFKRRDDETLAAFVKRCQEHFKG